MAQQKTDLQESDSDSDYSELGFPISGSLSPGVSSVSGTLGALGSLSQAFRLIYGSEGHIEIWVTNKMSKVIDIQLHSNSTKNSHSERQGLREGQTKIFSKKSRAGVGHTRIYEVELWWDAKHTRFYAYGEGAPRENNKFEVRELGVYLIKDDGPFLIAFWEGNETQQDQLINLS